ncbi:MAG: hypothetical protein ACK2UO_06010 [Caldilineaceae bacterium]
MLRETLRQHFRPIQIFNPRGQDFADLDSLQRLGALLRLCVDPTGSITDKVQGAISKHLRGTLDRWANDTHT